MFKGQAPPAGQDFRITTEQGRMSAERLYTLADIEALARHYCESAISTARLDDRLRLSLFIQWLRRQEHANAQRTG